MLDDGAHLVCSVRDVRDHLALARPAVEAYGRLHGVGDPSVTVHVTTDVDGVGTVVTLRGVADEGLVAMLADGIARLGATVSPLLVDASALTQPRTPTGRGLLDQLLGGAGQLVHPLPAGTSQPCP